MTIFTYDIVNPQVEFFADMTTAHRWADDHDGYVVTSWEDLYEMTGFQLATLHNVLAKELRAAGRDVDDVKRFATKGAAEDRIKRLVNDVFEMRPQVTKKPAKVKKSAAPKKRRGRGINLTPKDKAYPCRKGTKQSILVDMLSREQGATMSELMKALSGGNKPWKEVTVKSGLNWDMNNVKGYGIRTTDRDGADCYHLVLPEGMDAPHPHK